MCICAEALRLRTCASRTYWFIGSLLIDRTVSANRHWVAGGGHPPPATQCLGHFQKPLDATRLPIDECKNPLCASGLEAIQRYRDTPGEKCLLTAVNRSVAHPRQYKEFSRPSSAMLYRADRMCRILCP